jgi:DNA-binding transcriptional ArsR family regulator
MSEAFNTQVGVDPYNRFNDDPCAAKHGGNLDSMMSWRKTKDRVRKIHQEILTYYRNSPEPLSAKEIAERMGKTLNAISGRLTELKELGLLRATTQTYEGSRRLELVDDWLAREPLALDAHSISSETLSPENEALASLALAEDFEL